MLRLVHVFLRQKLKTVILSIFMNRSVIQGRLSIQPLNMEYQSLFHPRGRTLAFRIILPVPVNATPIAEKSVPTATIIEPVMVIGAVKMMRIALVVSVSIDSPFSCWSLDWVWCVCLWKIPLLFWLFWIWTPSSMARTAVFSGTASGCHLEELMKVSVRVMVSICAGLLVTFPLNCSSTLIAVLWSSLELSSFLGVL